jgi:hypothetical protein
MLLHYNFRLVSASNSSRTRGELLCGEEMFVFMGRIRKAEEGCDDDVAAPETNRRWRQQGNESSDASDPAEYT